MEIKCIERKSLQVHAGKYDVKNVFNDVAGLQLQKMIAITNIYTENG